VSVLFYELNIVAIIETHKNKNPDVKTTYNECMGQDFKHCAFALAFILTCFHLSVTQIL